MAARLTPAQKEYREALALVKKSNPGRSKFNAVPVTIPGQKRFDSTAEYERWLFLSAENSQGIITGLIRGVTYNLHVSGTKVGTYTPDFQYRRNNIVIIEDFKAGPTRTQLYMLKKKMMLAEYGIRIYEFPEKLVKPKGRRKKSVTS